MDTTADNAELLSTALQANWNVSGLGSSSDVTWKHTRYEAVADLQSFNTKIVLSTYNPADAVQTKMLTRECLQVTETVTVDVILQLRMYSDMDSLLSDRESISDWLLQTITMLQFQFTGSANVFPLGIPVKVEYPDGARLTMRTQFLTLKVFQVNMP